MKLAVSDAVIRRDNRLVQLQQQVSASLSAIGLTLTQMVGDKSRDNKEYIQLLSDAGRLLANIHYSESVSRRELIALNLNKELKETLTNTPINGLLFGNDLDSRIKAVQDLEKSGKQLRSPKKTTARPSSKPTSQASQVKHQGNYRGPFSQKTGARKMVPTTRAPPTYTQRRAHQFPRKQFESQQNDKRRRHLP